MGSFSPPLLLPLVLFSAFGRIAKGHRNLCEINRGCAFVCSSAGEWEISSAEREGHRLRERGRVVEEERKSVSFDWRAKKGVFFLCVVLWCWFALAWFMATKLVVSGRVFFSCWLFFFILRVFFSLWDLGAFTAGSWNPVGCRYRWAEAVHEQVRWAGGLHCYEGLEFSIFFFFCHKIWWFCACWDFLKVEFLSLRFGISFFGVMNWCV